MRAIDQRYLPSVKGIDLEQALNYVALADVGENFIYERFTGSRLPYTRGHRPELEILARRLVFGAKTPLKKVERLATFVAREVRWAGFYRLAKGGRLPTDRALAEEALIRSGYGWCNEQARVLCALTQVASIPSRLVFAAHVKKSYGHVITEVLLPEGWMAVDQSMGYCFCVRGKPVRANQVWGHPKMRSHFRPIYNKLCKNLVDVLGRKNLVGNFDMVLSQDPLDGFSTLGYHNYFIL